MLITWSTLEPEKARGEIVGYQVIISHNTTYTSETVVNPWLDAIGLVPGQLYTIRVSAVTKAGPGPFTAPLLVDIGPSQVDSQPREESDIASTDFHAPERPQWLIVLHIITPIVLLMSLATLLYVRKLNDKPVTSTAPKSSLLYQVPECLFSSRLPESASTYSENMILAPSKSQFSSASSSPLLRYHERVNEYAEPRFQKPNENTEPYATTTLLVPASPCPNHPKHWSRNTEKTSTSTYHWSVSLPSSHASSFTPHSMDYHCSSVRYDL